MLFGHHINPMRAHLIRTRLAAGLDDLDLTPSERAYTDDLLALRRAGVALGGNVEEQALAVLAVLPPRLRNWLAAHRSPYEIVSFVPSEATPDEVVESFTKAGGEGKARAGERGRDARGVYWRDAKGRKRRPQRPISERKAGDLMTKKHRQAARILKAYDGDMTATAHELGIHRQTLVRRLKGARALGLVESNKQSRNWKPIEAPEPKKRGKKKHAPRPEYSPPSPSGLTPEQVAQARALLGRLRSNPQHPTTRENQ